jgi:hypothetical protein
MIAQHFENAALGKRVAVALADLALLFGAQRSSLAIRRSTCNNWRCAIVSTATHG